MPLYSCAIVGTGREDDPFRPPFAGDGIGWICLGAPGTSAGRGLLYLPTASIDSRIRKIADDPGERTTNGVRNVWQNELGITLQRVSTATCAELMAKILMDHGREDGTRWRGIRGFPSIARLQHEVYLGALGRIWSSPIAPVRNSQSFSETWPSAGSITSGQDQTWTEQSNTGTVSGGVVQVGTPGTTLGVFHCSSALDTGNQYHEADYALTNGAGGLNFVSVLVRHSDTGNYYRFFVLRNNGTFQRQTLKRVANSNTVFVNDTTDPGASGTMKYVVDGATVTGYIGGVVTHGPTTDGSPELTTNLNGGVLIRASTTASESTMDNHTIADVVAATAVKDLIASGFIPFAR